MYVLLSIYISFCFAFVRSSQLGILCSYEGNCEWIPKTLYTGCLPADMSALTFIFFDSSSYIDLSCTSVQVVNIQSSELTCSRMSSLLTTSRAVSLQIGDNSCVSIDYTCKWGLFFFSQVHILSMNFIIIMINNHQPFLLLFILKDTVKIRMLNKS